MKQYAALIRMHINLVAQFQ